MFVLMFQRKTKDFSLCFVREFTFSDWIAFATTWFQVKHRGNTLYNFFFLDYVSYISLIHDNTQLILDVFNVKVTFVLVGLSMNSERLFRLSHTAIAFLSHFQNRLIVLARLMVLSWLLFRFEWNRLVMSGKLH